MAVTNSELLGRVVALETTQAHQTMLIAEVKAEQKEQRKTIAANGLKIGKLLAVIAAAVGGAQVALQALMQ